MSDIDKRSLFDEGVESATAAAGVSAFANRKWFQGVADRAVPGSISNKLGINLARRGKPIVGAAGLLGAGYDAATSGELTKSAFGTDSPSVGQYAAGAASNISDGLMLGQTPDLGGQTRQMYDFWSRLPESAKDIDMRAYFDRYRKDVIGLNN